MEKEEILKAIMELPKVETNNPISTMYGIDVDDLKNAIDRLNKIPSYDELLRENKKQKEIIDKAKEFVIDYKNQWTKTDDVVGDMQMLSNILEDKEV